MSEEITKPYQYRLATSEDASAVLAVLVEVAPEIPVETHDGRQELLLQQIKIACVYDSAWIALDRNNQIVGFLMAEPQRREIKLPYGGVRKGHREHDIFRKLMDKAKAMSKASGFPLTATVLHANAAKEGVDVALQKLGFAKVAPLDGVKNDGDNFRWSPAPSDTQGGTLS
jgi:ribosomal protein S18 acetylase RimI-like enzyme